MAGKVRVASMVVGSDSITPVTYSMAMAMTAPMMTKKEPTAPWPSTPPQ